MPRHSLAPYPLNWKDIALLEKVLAGWRCVRYGAPHNPEAGYTLTVHHLDMNPSHNDFWNLAVLCQRCHLHIQAKVDIRQVWMFEHSEWFKPYVAGYYAHAWGIVWHNDRVKVAANQDVLIDLGTGKITLEMALPRFVDPPK